MTITQLEQRCRKLQPGLIGVKRHYGVLVPLVEQGGDAHILFEVRADTMHRQPGEVCFPGGRAEEGETPEACAIRETCEELGIPRSAIHPIAPWDKLPIPGGLIHPLLARIDSEAAAAQRLNPAEVKETFLVPVDFFLNTEPVVHHLPLIPQIDDPSINEQVGFPQGYPWRAGEHLVPIWHYGGHAIWGITGRILLWHLGQPW